MLSGSTGVNKSDGLALPTSEKNPAKPGTIAYEILDEQNKRKQIFSRAYLQKDSESEDGNGYNWIVGKTYTAAESFSNFSAFSMDIFWEGSAVFFPYYNNQTDDLISGYIFSASNADYIRFKSLKIRYQRGQLTYSVESASIVDINLSGAVSVKKFENGKVIDGCRLYGLSRKQ